MDEVIGEAAPQVRVAGFWRRLAALVIDLILLGIVGSILGVFMFDTLAELGGYGRVLGFVIALGYFGVMNSHIGDGQTLGKRALDIEVEGIDGQPLTLTRSLIRYAVLGIPFFLNYAPLNDGLLAGPAGYTVALLVFGGTFSIVYLYIFNRRTRRSLHDLVVGSWVIRTEPVAPSPPPIPLWRGHLVVIGTLCVLTLLIPSVAGYFLRGELFSSLLAAYRAIAQEPGVQRASLSTNTMFSSKSKGATTLAAQVVLDGPRTDDATFARHIAEVIVRQDPDALKASIIDIRLVYGFDIGIASRWRAGVYRYAPDDLVSH